MVTLWFGIYYWNYWFEIFQLKEERRKERRKERREEEKKERKKGSKNFLKVVNLFPLNIVFSIVCVFPLLTFKLLLKVILHFIPERTNWKQNQKAKNKKQKQKKFFSNRVVHMWTKKINYLNWLKMKQLILYFTTHSLG